MRNIRRTYFIAATVVFASAVLFASCARTPEIQEQPVHREDTVNLKKIAVLPFQPVFPADPSMTFARCPLCGTMLRSCPVADGVERRVEDLFVTKLASYKKHVLLPRERVSGIYTRVSADSFTASPQDIALAVAREVDADWVVAGYVFCYKERKGYAYAVESPATVTFGIHLLSGRDGREVWKGVVDKKQESLMENLFGASAFSRGLKWLTADELTDISLDNLLKGFPGLA